ncbi:MAG: LamG domain-containing protein [Bacteroidia bacterium]
MLAFFLLTSCDENKRPQAQIIDCLPDGIQDDVIAFYGFEDGSLLDQSSSGAHLTNSSTAAPATDRKGNSRCAFEFDQRNGKTEFLTSQDTDFLNDLTSFSISLWYMPKDSSRQGGDFESLLHRNTTLRCPDRNGEWSVALFDCRRAVFGHNNSVWSETSLPFVGNTTCQDVVDAFTGSWYHLVAVKDNDEMLLYLNGVLHSRDTGPAKCSSMHVAEDIGDLFLGTDYTGLLDDIVILNRALTQTEVTDLYQLETCCGS